MKRNHRNIDLVNINLNAYINFGEIIPICSQYIEPKRKESYINEGP